MPEPAIDYDADDLSPDDVHPTQLLHDSNDDLGDPKTLRQRFEKEGYLLFRGVLDPESVAGAQQRMMGVLKRRGLVDENAELPIWSGRHWGDLVEASPEFERLGVELVEHPKNRAFFDRMLGEPGMIVPIFNHRFYPPGYRMGPPHQDGYYTQIPGYMVIWVPLFEITEETGGLAVAVGQTHRGYLHNPAKPPPSPIPKDAIPADAWARADYKPGDVLIFHERTPHCGIANRSQFLRITFDVRLIPESSAGNLFVGTVSAVTPSTLTLRDDNGRSRTFAVDEETYIRCGPIQATRIPLSELCDAATPGVRLVALHDGDHATMLRRATGE